MLCLTISGSFFMRRFVKGFVFAAVLPLAACFDADVTADFTDTDEVRLDAVMRLEAEVYQMIAGMGEDPCEDGVGAANADGSFTCTMSERRSLEQLLAAADDPDSELGVGEGMSIEELDNGNIAVSFDLSEMTSDLPPEDERAQVAAMFGDAFDGHAMTVTVAGRKIVSTNGEVVNGGKAARLVLPLSSLFMPETGVLPESFDVELEPGR